MTNRKYVLRSTSHSVHESEEKLLENQGLIVLLESTKYVRRNNTDRVRYLSLKQLCNEKLAYLTGSRETDFGGKFENYIVKFESKLEPDKRFLEREKIRRKESYIIPNVEKIEKLFSKHNISDLLGEELVPYKIKGPILENKYPKENDFTTLRGALYCPTVVPKSYTQFVTFMKMATLSLLKVLTSTQTKRTLCLSMKIKADINLFLEDRSIIQTYPV